MNPVQKHINDLQATTQTHRWVTMTDLAVVLRTIAAEIEPRASLIAGRPVSDTTRAAARGIVKSAAALTAIADELEQAKP